MEYYFDDELAVKQLRLEIDAWRGTPFLAHCAQRGGGGDCVATAAAIYQAIGAIGPIEWPRYQIHGESAETLLGHLDAVPGLARVGDPKKGRESDVLRPGDCLVGRDKAGILHLAIHDGDGFIWHMSRQTGWSRRHLQVARRAWELIAVYRPKGAPAVTDTAKGGEGHAG